MASRILLRSAGALRPAVTTMPTLQRGFAVSSSRQLKESAETKDYDKHKQDSLAKQKSGKGHWKPELASDGEEAIKADRSPKEDFAQMQERTKKHAEEQTAKGTSTKDPM
ncbi:hypothetical protein M406DRAFT_256078 [Cryphonectria parasitica EP155]|uniref:Mitochondrial carrier protein pet8 n=1 Tax=Cryphonectria parasitica (strain ATCC 38755 / EP155) TaxID=660469 RepID=A0A9P4Y5A4_CRYP1|nr:uncharacterized protein M406DRAFT_256078 [Cryphonectria parasitica EP155]KAF3766395.1 hypothetical protein M406DRAFT_256078 [Cryphonectria parasitica EP155]